MRLFCDHCGWEFSPGALRSESRFCSCCGKELSDFVREHVFDTGFRAQEGTSSDVRKAHRGHKRKVREEEEEEEEEEDDDDDDDDGERPARDGEGKLNEETSSEEHNDIEGNDVPDSVAH
jgi:hypothetical protein